MHKLNEKGFIHAFLFLLLLAGLGIGVYLVQTRTGWFSKAAPVIPDKPETSFKLAVDKAVPKNIPLGSRFRLDIWTRSDIDPANTFVAKLKFNPDELQVVEINDGNQSFVNQWIEKTFDNTAGKVSIVGGVNPPGLLTSFIASASADVKGVTSGLTAGVGTVNGARSMKVGEKVDFRADFGNTAKSGQIYITTSPDGKSDFTCPAGYAGGKSGNSKGEKWCLISEGRAPTLTGSFTVREAGDYIVAVNAFTNDSATYTGDPTTQCSGNPLPTGPSGNNKWSDCGPGSNFTLHAADVPPQPTPTPKATLLTASLEGPSTLKVGDQGYFKATLSGGAKSGQIWVTKGDGKSEFPCPSGENGKPYRASTGFYWCRVAEWKGTSIEGSYGTSEVGDYTAVVNAFVNSDMSYTADPSTECTGTPVSLGFDASKWSDCGSSSRLNIKVIDSLPTPISTAPPLKLTLMPPRLMASIIFEAKKAGNSTVHFADTSQILRSSDGLNIISAKKDLTVRIVPASVSAPIPAPTPTPRAVLSLDSSTSNLNRGCDFSVNVNVDTGGAITDGTDAILLYDPTRLTVASITSGKIYADYPSNDIDQNVGKITISGLSSVSTPFTGKGTLATVNFSVKDSAPLGATKIHFDFDPNNKNKSTDSNVVERETVVDVLESVVSGNYTVGTGVCSSQTPSTGSLKNGDVNSNGKIDLVDLSRLLAEFGKSGQSGADLNSDGLVNTLDLLQLRSILIENGTLSGR